MMLIRREMLWLTIAAIVMAGCVPHLLPKSTETKQPMWTVTLTATEADTPTQQTTDTDAPTLTPTATQYPIDTAQFAETAYNVKDSQILYTPDGGQPKQIASIEGSKFVFSIKGQEVSVDPSLAVVPEAKWFLNGAKDQVMAINDPTGTYWQYEFNRQTGEWEQKALPDVSTNVNAPTNIEWNDVISNRWATAVRQAIDSGKIPTFGSKVLVSPMEVNSEELNNYYHAGIDFSSPNFVYVTNPETRPVMYSAYSEVLLGGKWCKILTEQIALKGGGYGLFNLIDIDMLGWLEKRLSDGSYYLGPLVSMTSEYCTKYESDSSICLWFNNGNALATESIKKWLGQGFFDPLLERDIFMWGVASKWH